MNINHIILINLIRPTRVNYSKIHNHMWLIIDTCTCMHDAIVLLLVVFKSVRHVGEVADSDPEIWEGGGGEGGNCPFLHHSLGYLPLKGHH